MTKKSVSAFLCVLLILIAGACRSKPKPATTPVVTPEPQQAARIESPAGEFRPPVPEVREDFRGAELNRIARERGWIQDAFFAFDSNVLDDGARAALDASARWLRDNPDVRVIIEGHCDERGTEQYNLALGERRADTARQYLAALGIDGSRLSQISYGEEKPFATGSFEEAWRQNRRAHLRVER